MTRRSPRPIRDPAAGILAAADYRLSLLDAAGDCWIVDPRPECAALAAHETDPDHVRAAVRRWRGVIERHHLAHYYPQVTGSAASPLPKAVRVCARCVNAGFPCYDLTETADEAVAYLGGAS